MGLLDVPGLSRAQADTRYGRLTAYSPNDYDRARIAGQRPIYNGGDITSTLSAPDAGSGIASPVLIAGNDSAFRFTGGRLDAPVTIPAATTYYTAGNVTTSTIDGPPAYYVDFEIDSSDYEIKLYSTGATRGYRMWIDDKPFTASSIALTTNPAVYRIRNQLTARRPHHVRMLISGGFIGLTVGPKDTVWRASFPIWKKRAYFLGDSFTAGANPTVACDTYLYLLGELLGWEPLGGGEASTGYAQNGTGGNGRTNFLNRIVTDVVPQAPDVVVIYGGTNDAQGGFQAACEAVYASLATNLPNVPVYVVGCQWPSAGASAVRDDKDAQMTAACAAHPNVVRRILEKPWITGLGNAGAPTGTGNSDLYTSSDGLHPTSAGHFYRAHRMAEAIIS